eukprot:761776-Hanusia_phi.AAC.4
MLACRRLVVAVAIVSAMMARQGVCFHHAVSVARAMAVSRSCDRELSCVGGIVMQAEGNARNRREILRSFFQGAAAVAVTGLPLSSQAKVIRPAGLEGYDEFQRDFISKQVPPGLQLATFSGGCFWCMEPPFDAIDGVVSTTSGYCGGDEAYPNYNQVSLGLTHHAESMQVLFDPSKVSYEKLLDTFWHNIDPTTKDRQFCDSGKQYRTIVFYHNELQRQAFENSRLQWESSKKFGAPIVVECVKYEKFWPAEDYHQDYYLKNEKKYKFYRYLCGRDRYLDKTWSKEATKKPLPFMLDVF